MSTAIEKESKILSNYLDTAASIFLVINADHSIELVNKKGCEVLGYKRNEIVGKDWFKKFIPKEDRKELSKLFDHILDGRVKAPEVYENWVSAKGKQQKLIQWRNAILKNDDDIVIGLISSGVDVTANKAMENALNVKNRALEAAANGIVIADAQQPNLPIIYSNWAFTRITGYRQSEVLGKNCRFLQNDDRDQKEIEILAKAIKEGKPCRVVLRNYRKDGSLFWNEVSLTPLYDKNQKLTHFIGVQNDVTEIRESRKELETYAETLEIKVQERTKELQTTVQKLVETNLSLEDQIGSTKIAENKIRESQALTSAIAQNFPKGAIVVFNLDYELVFVEGEEMQRIDFKKSDFEGKRIDELPIFSKKQVTKIKEDIRQTLKGKDLSFEINYQGASYAVNSTPLYSEKKQAVWALFVYNNITEQKSVQQQLANALAAEQELNELKSRFISMASHEFRTPLSAILSSAILIGKQNEPGKESQRAKHVGRIRNGVKSLVIILNDFLSLSKLEEGKVRANPKHFELLKFSKLLIEELESSTKSGQHILLKTKQKRLLLYQDPKLLSHILINLLSNATKYSDEGEEIILEISSTSKEVVLKAIDNGIGIPEDEQQHLFERFFRAVNATNIQGTGLGLHIVKQYVELLEGTISFKSKQGKGSTFIVQLPQNLEHYAKNTID